MGPFNGQYLSQYLIRVGPATAVKTVDKKGCFVHIANKNLGFRRETAGDDCVMSRLDKKNKKKNKNTVMNNRLQRMITFGVFSRR